MLVRCPLCHVAVDARLKRSAGYVYTLNGLPVFGEPDSTGQMHPSQTRFRGQYHLASWPYSIMECPVCKGHFVAEAGKGPVWPLPSASVAEEIPAPVRLMLLDAKRAHAVGAEAAALLALRTAVVRMWREQKCESLDQLQEAGRITAILVEQAREIGLWERLVGDEELPTEPEADDVDRLLRYVEHLFDTLYVQPARLRELRVKS